MDTFATLVDKLYFTSGNLAKAALITAYLRTTPDPDRGWAIAAIGGTLSFDFFKRKLIKDLITARVDPTLFDLSYDYVGEMSETVSHLWRPLEHETERLQTLPSLGEIVTRFANGTRAENQSYLILLMNSMNAVQRWALLKLGTRGLRIGVSARFLKKILAEYGHAHDATINIEQIEKLWHGVAPPYADFLAWLEGKAPQPDVTDKVTFQPVMLSHPLEETALESISPMTHQAEWKFDGIRAQLVVSPQGKALFSRTGDDISGAFPDVVSHLDESNISGVFDGELVALDEQNNIASFNQLQQRLNKKKPSAKLMANIPCGLILYDCMTINGEDIREQTLEQRQQILTQWFKLQPYPFLFLSERLPFDSVDALRTLRDEAATMQKGYIEGLMIKQRQSTYVSGRPKGKWYKWKRDPLVIDAVMMYAQRGHGKRSSFYSDYTFGCWDQDQLLPVGKAYSGFTDEELKDIDRWVRNNTIGRFGPVKEVKKELVFELAFDSVHTSTRHKSGLAMRFPRVHRIRWDKPANEADSVDSLKKLIRE